jgi:hypothetical protein
MIKCGYLVGSYLLKISSVSKILGFHGDDHVECRLLGYENRVRTSQETHYFSVTELSPLMLCKT